MRRLSRTKIELETALSPRIERRKRSKRIVAKSAGQRASKQMAAKDSKFFSNNAWTVVLSGDREEWGNAFGGLIKFCGAVNDTENLELFGGYLSLEKTADGVRRVLADAFFDGDINERMMKRWYPDDSVTKKSQWAGDLKYTYDIQNHTAKALPFRNTEDPDSDNSDKAGHVVIPPYVDHEGIRYKVSGVVDAYNMGGGYNNNLTSIVAPTTVTSIGVAAFFGCASLTSVSLTSVANIGEAAFYECASLASVSLPAVIDIEDYAFYGCTTLTAVSLPAATGIGGSAFTDCTSLASVSLPVATDIGGYAFSNCTSLASVSLPAATGIGGGAFTNCDSLSTLDLSSFERSSIESKMASWGIYPIPGQTITITASDETFTITGGE